MVFLSPNPRCAAFSISSISLAPFVTSHAALFETAKEIGIKKIVDELNKLAEEHGEFYKPDPLLVSMQ